MSRGSGIVISSNPKGTFLSGIAGDTSKPGTIMAVKAATERIGNNFTYVASAPGTDGQGVLFAVLLGQDKSGVATTTAVVAGEIIWMYVPVEGEEVNVLVGEVAGTGNTYAIGDKLEMDAEDGILVPMSTSQQPVAIMMETLTQQSGSYLAWVRRCG